MQPASYTNYSTSKSREEFLEDEDFVNPLPRAVLRKNTPILLDGEWSFALDPTDAGLQEKWYLIHHYQDTAQWPGSIEEHIARVKGIKDENAWQGQVVAWYEREFPLPQMAVNGTPGMLQLTFGACGYETRVWLNGILLKTIEGEEIHFGEYTSFSYELPDENLKPVNRLTVRIADTMDADIPRGKQESNVYKRGGIWYQTYSGAVRSIWLEQVERNRLRSRVGVVSVIEDNLVRFNITTRIHDAGAYTVRFQIFNRMQEGETPLASSDFLLQLEAGQKQQRLVIEVPGAKLWSPQDPHLYKLVAQLIDANGHVAEIETYFGLRKIEARGCCVYLNNKPIYLDGILYQPATSTYEQIKRHMLAMKKLGCNLVRIHIAGVDPRVYNLADKLGMLLWVEVPSPHRSSLKSRENHRAELLRMLDLIGSHPAVVIWSLYNEDWGAQDIATNEETRKYIVDMYHYMMLAQPQFLVVDNDGWHHISYLGRLKSDLLTVHIYTPVIEEWKKTLDKLVAGELVGVAANPLVVGDPFFYRRQVPLVVSEWGGFGFVNYGGPSNEMDRVELIKAYKKELGQRSIAGDVYTQATNIEEEKNGLINIETGELFVPEGILKRPASEK
ncbi:MAG: glycoside hydrolase family 2 [Parafilimonas sp.]|nr:glycoside hydrolase family 2 [Parafilimonas sp.]